MHVCVCVCFMVLGLMGWRRLGCDWNIVRGERCRLDTWIGRKIGTFESKNEPPWSRSLVGTCGGSDESQS